jgi:hypothetical protein
VHWEENAMVAKACLMLALLVVCGGVVAQDYTFVPQNNSGNTLPRGERSNTIEGTSGRSGYTREDLSQRTRRTDALPRERGNDRLHPRRPQIVIDDTDRSVAVLRNPATKEPMIIVANDDENGEATIIIGPRKTQDPVVRRK